MSLKKVLIVARDDLIAALLAFLVERRGYTAIFAAPRESCVAALQRTKADVIVIDMDHQEACADDFLTFARGSGVRLVMFSSSREAPEVKRFAAQYNVPGFSLPITGTELGDLIEKSLSA